MSTFTIEPDNNITALVELPTDADRSTTFSSEKELKPADTLGERVHSSRLPYTALYASSGINPESVSRASSPLINFPITSAQ